MKDTIHGNKEFGFNPKGDSVTLKDVKQRNNVIKFSFKKNQSSVHC